MNTEHTVWLGSPEWAALVFLLEQEDGKLMLSGYTVSELNERKIIRTYDPTEDMVTFELRD